MISLLKILKEVLENKDNEFVPLDEWKWNEVDYLANMEFQMDGEYNMITTSPPYFKVYLKKEKNEEGKEVRFYYLEEKKKETSTKRFRKFNDLIDYFDTYSQPEIDQLK